MQSRLKIEESVDLDAYLKLFAPYVEQLRQFSGREGEYGGRFALLFRQVVRLLPKPFVGVAQHYLEREAETVRHFSYEDNRHFFLSDLFDWLQIQERGRRMREMGKD